MTGKEFEILMLLAQNGGRVFNKEQIYDAIRNNEYIFDKRNMTSYINKIRKKIESDLAHPRYVITVWGVGYKFNGNHNGLIWENTTSRPNFNLSTRINILL